MRNARSHITGIQRAAIHVTLALSAIVLCGGALGSASHPEGLPQGARDALKSEFGLSDAELESRVALERAALQQDRVLKQELGPAYAGSWLDEKTSALKVATTDPLMETVIRSTGAIPVVHAYSMSDLTRAMQRLNEDFSGKLTGAIASWHVDVRDNRVVITILPQRTAEAVDVIAMSRVSLDMIQVEHTMERPELMTSIYGGAQYNSSSGPLCSAGFAVNGGFVTAGHCGDQYDPVYTSGNVLMGQFAESDYPGDDMAYVETDTGFYPQASLLTYVGGTLPVSGSTVAPIGAYVCRSGFTTEWQCGKIENRPASVNYGSGIVYGLTESSACASFGDSGGPFINASSQGQGVTSGGSHLNCKVYFQPLNEILNAYSLTLSTSSGAPSGSPPQITNFTCPDYGSSGGGSFRCWVQYSSSGQTSVSWLVNSIFVPTSSNNVSLWKSCFGTTPQTVRVKVANLFGSDVQETTFDCPGNIIIP